MRSDTDNFSSDSIVWNKILFYTQTICRALNGEAFFIPAMSSGTNATKKTTIKHSSHHIYRNKKTILRIFLILEKFNGISSHAPRDYFRINNYLGL